jgi:hypothetical protein
MPRSDSRSRHPRQRDSPGPTEPFLATHTNESAGVRSTSSSRSVEKLSSCVFPISLCRAPSACYRRECEEKSESTRRRLGTTSTAGERHGPGQYALGAADCSWCARRDRKMPAVTLRAMYMASTSGVAIPPTRGITPAVVLCGPRSAASLANPATGDRPEAALQCRGRPAEAYRAAIDLGRR